MNEKQLQKTEPKYSKAQLYAAKEFAEHKDIIAVVIEEEERITKNEAKKRIAEFMKRRVN